MLDVKLPKQVVDRLEARWSARHNRAIKRMSRLVDSRLEQIRAHRNNVQRYRRLLKTTLTDLEREFIERRLSEEIAAARHLAATMPPLNSVSLVHVDKVRSPEVLP